MLRLLPVETDEQLSQLKELFLEYAGSLGFDLDFQGIEPYRYNPIEGALYMELTLDAQSHQE